jgi:hypothetical protein
MKLSGQYSFEDMSRALQGDFLCQSVTRDGKGKLLPEDKQYIALELFFLRFEFYKDKTVAVYKIEEDKNGTKKLVPMMTVEGK